MNVVVSQRGGRWTKYAYVRVRQLNMLLLQCISYSDHNMAMIVPYIIDVKSTHDRMICETLTSIYGNNTVKEFLRAFINYSLFDKAY